MKDSEGREYDGWVLKNRKGHLLPWSFQLTRTKVLHFWSGSYDKVEAVKVRLEVVE